eukprot:scaffold3377_cov105-Isochrysis_galbana.AAC.7
MQLARAARMPVLRGRSTGRREVPVCQPSLHVVILPAPLGAPSAAACLAARRVARPQTPRNTLMLHGADVTTARAASRGGGRSAVSVRRAGGQGPRVNCPPSRCPAANLFPLIRPNGRAASARCEQGRGWFYGPGQSGCRPDRRARVRRSVVNRFPHVRTD